MATLMDVGWDARTGTTWSRPELDGTTTEWHVVEKGEKEFGDFIDHRPILYDMKQDINRKLWHQAAKHEDGDNLEEGADVLHVKRELDKLALQGRWAEWSRLLAIVCEGQWCRGRKRIS